MYLRICVQRGHVYRMMYVYLLHYICTYMYVYTIYQDINSVFVYTCASVQRGRNLVLPLYVCHM